ncbi:MAG TPA: PQQ-binding-like beta-propeller repeat protein [Solirubrobacteraceae bacterium]|nr:PQQ-binding-like beta-propeller repeat protein [Solirubrobacteraceae bacterium]
MRRRWLLLAAALLIVAVAVGIGGYLYERHRTGSIYHPKARFVPEAPPPLPPRPVDRSAWPMYGYNKEHTRFFPSAPTLRPPFQVRWEHYGSALLEFPPVLRGERLFQLSDDGVLAAISKHNGHVLWARRLGALSASSPAVDSTTVYVTLLQHRHNSHGGLAAALDYTTGRIKWLRDLSSESESSPMLDHGTLYFGSQNGTVYALNAHNGNVVWTYHAAGPVKASPTLKDGWLYFGDYSGQVQALDERTGRRMWRSGSEGALLGSGTFYSTAAVAYGRVFLGNTDGRFYAYDDYTGKLDWAYQTGAYVYSSPAVASAPGLGPTIYMGSYDGRFYALSARTGHVQWSYNAHGRISGSPTVVGNVVYFADLGTHTTYGLGISTGHVVFTMHSGSFDPVITDGKDVYLTGYTGLFGLAPGR